MRIIECQQNDPVWLVARRGLVTASRIADVCAKLKGKGEAKSRQDYKWEKLIEIRAGFTPEHYVSPAMEWGTQNEDLARAAYDIATGITPELVGFVLHPRLERCGASPDGLVGKDGLVEIKCPSTSTHYQYIFADVVPEAYQLQMLWQMACADRRWCDFVSYNPRVPEQDQLFIKRFPRDDTRIHQIEIEVVQFWKEVDAMLAALPPAKPDNKTVCQRMFDATAAELGPTTP